MALAASAAVLAACGGGESARQDADEPAGEFPVEVSESKFPNRQRLAETSDLVLAVENLGDEQIPELAVSINTDDGADGAFSTDLDQEDVAARARPVWILEDDYPKIVEPGIRPQELDAQPGAGAEAAQTNTFAFGPLAPGDELVMDWRVTPVKAGTYTLRYEIAAGLTGKAKAVTADGSPVEGSFVVTISDRPPNTCVDPAGRVQEGGKCEPTQPGGLGLGQGGGGKGGSGSDGGGSGSGKGGGSGSGGSGSGGGSGQSGGAAADAF